MQSSNTASATVSNIEECFSKSLDKSQVLSNYQANFWGLGVEFFNLPAGEIPQEIILNNYTIVINLGQNHNVEQITDGRYEKALIFTGGIGIFPFQMLMWIQWDRERKHLYIHLEPKQLSHRSQELFGEEKCEILPIFLPVKDILIQQIGLGIENEITRNRNGSRIYVQSMTDALTINLLQNYSTQTKPVKTSSGGLSPHKLKLVQDFIHDNLEQEIGLDKLAKVAKLNRSHFSRAFKRSMGITPHQYIIQQRVERAKQLLLRGKTTIADIAIACGFTHQSHLNRHFKRLTGVTPKVFRDL